MLVPVPVVSSSLFMICFIVFSLLGMDADDETETEGE